MRTKVLLKRLKLDNVVIFFFFVVVVSLLFTLVHFSDAEETFKQSGASSILKEGDYFYNRYAYCRESFAVYDENQTPIQYVKQYGDLRDDGNDNIWHVLQFSADTGTYDVVNCELVFYLVTDVVRRDTVELCTDEYYYYLP